MMKFEKLFLYVIFNQKIRIVGLLSFRLTSAICKAVDPLQKYECQIPLTNANTENPKQGIKSYVLHESVFSGSLTLFDMGGDAPPPNVFDHYAQTLRRRKLKLGDF